MLLNERKLAIHFDIIRETQGEENYNKMCKDFNELVDYVSEMSNEDSSQTAYLKVVDSLVEIYDKKYPEWFVDFINEKATTPTAK